MDAQPLNRCLHDRPVSYRRRDGDTHGLLIFDSPLLSAIRTGKEPSASRPAADWTRREDWDPERDDHAVRGFIRSKDDLHLQGLNPVSLGDPETGKISQKSIK